LRNTTLNKQSNFRKR